MACPPAGCALELRGLKADDLNGRRGICLGQIEQHKSKDNVLVCLDDDSRISVGLANVFPLFVARPIAGKGVGIVAELEIRAGDVLVEEKAVLRGEGLNILQRWFSLAMGLAGGLLRAWLAGWLVGWLLGAGLLRWSLVVLAADCYDLASLLDGGFCHYFGCFLGFEMGRYCSPQLGGFIASLLGGVFFGFWGGINQGICCSAASMMAACADLPSQFEKLSPTTKAEVMALHDCSRLFKESQLPGVVFTNALATSSDSSGGFAFSLRMSRFNHSCKPNALAQWLPDGSGGGLQFVRAVQDIKPGMEICISYLGNDCLAAHCVRRKRLLYKSRFFCICDACASAAADPSRLSDGRRRRLASLMLRLNVTTKSDSAMALVEEQLDLLARENITDPSFWAEACIKGFFTVLEQGDLEEVKKWAAKTYEYFCLCYGEDDERTFRMYECYQDPSQASSLFELDDQSCDAAEANK